MAEPAIPSALQKARTTAPILGAAVNDQWMNLMAADLSGKKLAEVVLPGTHDSGTGGISDLTGPWVAKAQGRTVGEQLNDGIRYLDFRVRETLHFACATPDSWVFYHGAVFGERGFLKDSGYHDRCAFFRVCSPLLLLLLLLPPSSLDK